MAYATHTHITSWRYALAPYLAAEKKKLVKPCRSENEIKKKKNETRANDMQIDALYFHGPSNIMESDAVSSDLTWDVQ